MKKATKATEGTYWMVKADDGRYWADLWSTAKIFDESTGFETPWTFQRTHAKRFFEREEAFQTCGMLQHSGAKVVRVTRKGSDNA